LIHQGKSYPMTQHGFARDKQFECIESQGSAASFRLQQDEQSLRQYPFPFELDIHYALLGNRLMTVYTIRNQHDQELPFSIGGHPAFNWPLFSDTKAADYFIEFEQVEAEKIWQLENGLITKDLRPSPLSGKILELTPTLFDNDALIFPDVNSSRVFFGTKAGKGIAVSYVGLPDLGIWSKPGAPFVCIEPWLGHSSPQGFDGEFSDKPGVEKVAPFSERQLSYSFEILA